MPRKPIDYTNTIFYKIVCKDFNITDIYIGHTTDFSKRKNHHKYAFTHEDSNNGQCYLYTFMRENGGWQNFDMVMIEQMACDSSLDACKRERELIESLQATLNTCIPSRDKAGWYQDNRDLSIARVKNLYAANKEAILTYHKQYYDENKEMINSKQKSYRSLNKDKLNEHAYELITCSICDAKVMRQNMLRHEQTQKHKQSMINK